jgi:hypothetical protein
VVVERETTAVRALRATSAAIVASFILAAVLLMIAVQLATARTANAAVARGVVDHRLEYSNRMNLTDIPLFADQVAATGATWTRVFVRWNHLQPQAPGRAFEADQDGDGYDDGYVTELEAVVQALQARGVRVMFCANDIPKWAADPDYAKGKYTTSGVMRTGSRTVMAEFQRFAGFMAGHFPGVKHFEVWNEPNLASGIYPQIVGTKAVGPAAYVKMLKAFWTGARLANRSAVVIAGATSRFGSNGNDPGSTSPQWFARYLKAHKASRWFNAYSHHPYTKRGSDPKPSVPPRGAKKSVTLGNISVLLKIFPGKPFYLTEFCYSTAGQNKDLFCVVVSKADQARYLRQAWAFAAKYKQIKVMLWFLVRDWEKYPGVTPGGEGVYTGLHDYNGVRKPAWWAFVGGNTLTIDAPPASAAPGAPFDLSGVLTTRDGPGAGVTVKLQRRGLAGKAWETVSGATATTDENGAYTIAGVTQTAARYYRVIWDGVIESRRITVTLAK